MSSTKDKILDTALRLFNEAGLAKVTMRVIAQAVPMSLGNLTYHYKKREALIEALYHRLVAHMDAVMHELATRPLDLALLQAAARSSMTGFYAYRFFMLDYTQLMRAHAPIRTHYQQLTVQRRGQFELLLGALVGCGVLRPPAFPQEYDYAYQRLQVYGDFWLSALAIQDEPMRPELVDEHLTIVMAGWYPYLTAMGRAQYEALS